MPAFRAAPLPVTPSTPSRCGLWLAGALFLGLGAGIGWLYSRSKTAAPAGPATVKVVGSSQQSGDLFGATPWAADTNYPVGAMVSIGAGMLSGSFYQALRPSRGVVPAEGPDWHLVAQS